MKRTAVVLLFLFPLAALGQVYFEPGIGMGKDLNNKNGYYVLPNFQLAIKFSKVYSLVFQAQKDFSISDNTYSDMAYSLNTSLPAYSPAAKAIQRSIVSVGLGNRLNIAGFSKANKFFIGIYTGIGIQKATVSYSYDKDNYIILNPEKSDDVVGLYLGLGLGYQILAQKNRLLMELRITSQPSSGKSTYPNSYQWVAPLSLHLSYSIKL